MCICVNKCVICGTRYRDVLLVYTAVLSVVYNVLVTEVAEFQ